MSSDTSLPPTTTKKRQHQSVQLTEEYAATLDDNVKRAKREETAETTVCIIGPASVRNINLATSQSNKMTLELFDAMVRHTTRWIETNLLNNGEEDQSSSSSVLDWSSIRLSSSGSAWSDHIAILIYLEKHSHGATLTLHLPCEFLNGAYVDNGKKWSGLHNPGGIMNDQHSKFGAIVKRDTLADVALAKSLGATFQVVDKGGFFACSRALIHECDELIAFGWDEDGEGSDQPSTPGTRYTWNLAPKWTRKHLVNLSDLK